MSHGSDDLPDEDPEIKRLLGQLPPPPAPVHCMDTDRSEVETIYPDDPPGLFPIALLKSKYATEAEAYGRALELASKRGVKIHRFFETALSWVAQCFKPIAFPANDRLGF